MKLLALINLIIVQNISTLTIKGIMFLKRKISNIKLEQGIYFSIFAEEFVSAFNLITSEICVRRVHIDR